MVSPAQIYGVYRDFIDRDSRIFIVIIKFLKGQQFSSGCSCVEETCQEEGSW